MVDDDFYAYLTQWKWHAWKGNGGYYALRQSPHPILPRRQIAVRMHRVVLELAGQDLSDGRLPDHRNGNTLDNQLHNLRSATTETNPRNCLKYKNNTSGFKGVSFDKTTGKWRAQININKRRVSLGYFTSPEEAALVYDQAAKTSYGEFAKLNSELT